MRRSSKKRRPLTPPPRKNSPLSDSAQRAAGLYQAKLKGLVTNQLGTLAPNVAVTPFSGGAGLVVDTAGWAYFHDSAISALGAALVWGSASKVESLNVIVDTAPEAAPLARQATAFAMDIAVWVSVGTALQRAVPTRDAEVVPLHPAVENYRSVFEEAGAEITRDGQDMVAEILGLEVARVRLGPEGGAVFNVGVGEYDQAAHAMLAHDVGPRLRDVVAEVRMHRNQAARPHAINRVARERWLRTLLVAQPELVGARTLKAVDELSPRSGVRETTPVAARGVLTDGRSVLVVCSVGLDLQLVPVAAAHLAAGGADAVVLGLPERDVQPVMERTAALLAAPCKIVALPAPWPS